MKTCIIAPFPSSSRVCISLWTRKRSRMQPLLIRRQWHCLSRMLATAAAQRSDPPPVLRYQKTRIRYSTPCKSMIAHRFIAAEVTIDIVLQISGIRTQYSFTQFTVYTSLQHSTIICLYLSRMQMSSNKVYSRYLRSVVLAPVVIRSEVGCSLVFTSFRRHLSMRQPSAIYYRGLSSTDLRLRLRVGEPKVCTCKRRLSGRGERCVCVWQTNHFQHDEYGIAMKNTGTYLAKEAEGCGASSDRPSDRSPALPAAPVDAGADLGLRKLSIGSFHKK